MGEEGVASANYVSCFSQRAPGAGAGVLGAQSDLWWPSSNPHSEWGAWALQNGVNHACVSRRPTRAHCARRLVPQVWDTPFVEADTHTVVELVRDAAHRLRSGSTLSSCEQAP